MQDAPISALNLDRSSFVKNLELITTRKNLLENLFYNSPNLRDIIHIFNSEAPNENSE